MSDKTYFCPNCGQRDFTTIQKGDEEYHEDEWGTPLECLTCDEKPTESWPYFEEIDDPKTHGFFDREIYAVARAYHEWKTWRDGLKGLRIQPSELEQFVEDIENASISCEGEGLLDLSDRLETLAERGANALKEVQVDQV